MTEINNLSICSRIELQNVSAIKIYERSMFDTYSPVESYLESTTDVADHLDWRVFDATQKEIENVQQKHKTSNLLTK